MFPLNDLIGDDHHSHWHFADELAARVLAKGQWANLPVIIQQVAFEEVEPLNEVSALRTSFQQESLFGVL